MPADYLMDPASAKALRDCVNGGGTILSTSKEGIISNRVVEGSLVLGPMEAHLLKFRVSCLFGSECLDRLDGSGAARRDETCQDADQGQAGRNASQQQEVVAGVHFYDRC